jgi:hypothetical protein
VFIHDFMSSATARTKRVHNWMYRDGMYVRKLSEAAMDAIDARFATVWIALLLAHRFPVRIIVR